MGPLVPGSHPFAVVAFALAVSSLCGACSFDDDCSFSDTCSDSLHDRAIENFSNADPECGACIDDCTSPLTDCSNDPLCNYMARCLLATDPVAYQQCLEDLSQQYSDGSEKRRPWEGGPGLNNKSDSAAASAALYSKVEKCFKPCHKACLDPLQWTCAAVEEDDPSMPGRARLAVRTFPNYEFAECVRVQSCSDESGGCVGKGKRTGDDGRVDLDLPYASQESVYFRLEPVVDDAACSADKSRDFPPTRFYPGYISASQVQPIAVYVMRKDKIEEGNRKLDYGGKVLKNLGQSLILPDSCVWSEISAKGVQIEASGESDKPIQQCHREAHCECEADLPDCDCPPCIWYSKGKEVRRQYRETYGTGAGIVGLAPGSYTVSVEADEAGVVSERNFKIDAGEMVVIRTWRNVSNPKGSP